MKIAAVEEIVVPGKRLGRHIEHDPRSKAFAISAYQPPLVTRAWMRHCPPFDQGDLGSCTGNALAGLLMTAPFYTPGRNLDEADAVSFYEAASKLDKITGHYPPDDTGSSGLAVAKAGARAGYFRAYHHAFGLHRTLCALMHGPVLLGIPWFESFDEPQGPHAELVIGGEVRGGHEVELLAVDVDTKMVRACNSWGEGWGDAGYFALSWATLEALLAQDGDVVVPMALPQP